MTARASPSISLWRNATRIIGRSLVAGRVAIATEIRHRPSAPIGVNGIGIFLGPDMIERRVVSEAREEAMVRPRDRPQIGADGIVEDSGDGTGRPAVISHHVADARDYPISVRIKFSVRLTKDTAATRPCAGRTVRSIVGRAAEAPITARQRAGPRLPGAIGFDVGPYKTTPGSLIKSSEKIQVQRKYGRSARRPRLIPSWRCSRPIHCTSCV